MTNENVDEILVENGKVKGVKTKEAVFCQLCLANVTPHQLYEKLLPGISITEYFQKDVKNYKYGRIHANTLCIGRTFKLEKFRIEKSSDDKHDKWSYGVSQSVNEAYNGLLPKEATIAVGQHTALDPSRLQKGKLHFGSSC